MGISLGISHWSFFIDHLKTARAEPRGCTSPSGSWRALFRFLRMYWDREPGDGSAGALPYGAHPTSDAYRRGGGSWRA
ncbi:hypothetical protein SBV1_580001 [Verrucomicrobia bacterium]|nr:hypothetical protein SBV1_580001 [Verrucomicrobiota bacterium]